ncbi:unnamed protein product, partial [Effrenium voratum]
AVARSSGDTVLRAPLQPEPPPREASQAEARRRMRPGQRHRVPGDLAALELRRQLQPAPGEPAGPFGAPLVGGLRPKSA